MKASDNCLALIKHFEGLYLKAYKDSVQKLTIGYGTTRYPDGREVDIKDTCTKEDAEEFLINDISTIEPKINRHFKEINQNQFDALVSWVYNIGFGNLLISTLRKKILEDPNSPEVEREWMKWIYAGRTKMKGLYKRRKAEYLLYSTGRLSFDE